MSLQSSENTATPELSVVVLTHNRCALLRRTLASVLRTTGDAAEVIVVDNGSRDDTAATVRSEFPSVRLIVLPENTGIAGRNRGFATAKGRIVFSLDDDIELLDPGMPKRLVALFDAEPTLGALTLKICEESTGSDYVPAHWWHPLPRQTHQDRSFSTDRINEAAAAFRRSAFEAAGGYYERLFWGGEEYDLVLGLLDAGFEIRYVPEPVLHLAPRGSLNERADPRHALLIRNRCWIALRRLPLTDALTFSIPRLSLWAVRSVRYNYLGQYMKGVAGLVRGVPEIARDRQPITRSTRTYLRALRAPGRSLLVPPVAPTRGGNARMEGFSA